MKNIIIVGGGSAGWMSAATLIRAFPNKNITVIESPDVSTIGVGESTLGHINGWLNYLNIEDKDFMPHCDASYKLSIKFTDFYKKGAGSFHYPFGRPYYWDNKERNKWYFRKQLLNLPNSDYAECMSPNVLMSNANKISDENDIVPNYNFKTDSAYHFDATKFGLWLKEHYCLPRGVKHVLENVNHMKQDGNGITHINSHECDLVIDCTGFKSMILNKVGGEFISYNDILPNDSAWATRMPYTNKEQQLEPYTNCTAIENGWVWNIPSWERIGTGYVYSSKYINDDDALTQFKQYLGRDDLEFKNIRMRVGRQKEMWIKNVCAIGLSAGFIEPLESTGLLQTHTFIMKLVSNLERGDFSQWDRDTHNLECNNTFDEYASFVAMHYALSLRDDTPYWQDVRKRSLIHLKDVPSIMNAKMQDYYFNPFGGMHYIATGLNWQAVSLLDVEQLLYDPDTKEINEEWTNHLEQNKQEWQKIVNTMPSLYEYLRDNIYENRPSK
tara:strand:+ start:249 stop:1742 length:1494 start_codon:yes stop_codon:yes gene_type:complete